MMLNSIHVQVINLDRSTDRWQCISEKLSAVCMKYIRTSATDGRSLSADDMSYYSPFKCLIYYGRRLSTGEIGCFRSHQRAAQAFLDSGKEFGLVLEDDADIPDNFHSLIYDLSKQLSISGDIDWELVNLGNSPKHPTHYIRLGQATNNHQLVKARVFPKRTTALLWSRKGAQRFLDETRVIRAPVDQHLHSALSKRETGLATLPCLVTHAEVASDINSEHDAHSVRQVGNPSLWYTYRGKMRKRSARRGKTIIGNNAWSRATLIFKGMSKTLLSYRR